MIADSVAFCRESGKRVVFDAEHFFDGYRDDAGYALECVRAAADAGAENVTLCDTNGGSLPGFVAEATAAVVADARRARSRSASTPTTTPSAPSPTASPRSRPARGWCRARVNGYGERCGNANLASILPALQLKMGFDVVSAEQLAGLTPTAHYLDELCNMAADPDQPYVGRNAFAHKAGMHAAGVEADAAHLRAPRPGAGRQRPRDPRLRALRQGDDPLAGRAGRARARRRGGGAGGRAPQGARAPRLPLRGGAGLLRAAAAAARRRATRRSSGSRASGSTTEKRADGEVETEATIKVEVDGERYVKVAEGNGPVNALDRALRAAIVDRHPHLADIELTNYKVRILDETHGTEAVTRVLLDSSDGEREWGTIGVSENIIEASWEALVDSLEYAFQPRR